MSRVLTSFWPAVFRFFVLCCSAWLSATLQRIGHLWLLPRKPLTAHVKK